jgi:uncharacterized protein YdhG (YjbR/CyaY superfamily)
MNIEATSVADYLSKVPEEKKEAFFKLRETVLKHIPDGFDERMSYGLIGYVVPHETFPDGYHCDPKLPLPFLNIAVQKNFIGFYHMGLYANNELTQWFVDEYAKQCKYKLDMGKSCVRLKRMDDIPYDLIAELLEKMSMQEWIKNYQASRN